LIGGSFALALRKAGFQGRLLGVSSPEAMQAALQLGIVDQNASLEQAAEQADLIYLAQPIERILARLEELQRLNPGGLITDAGSTKLRIVEKAAGLSAQFLGGHPMAGKETRGVESASADLFRGFPYILTPRSSEELQTPVAKEFQEWLVAIGARVEILDANEHDRLVAATSHLPQLISTALALALQDEKTRQTAGPAIREMTRLARSPYDVWRDIFGTNDDEIRKAIAGFRKELDRLEAALTREEMASYFEQATRNAERLR
jgi:prephenate dehydrogenase